MVGHLQQYAADEGTMNYGCCELRSLRWKGAITVTQNGRWANLYIGYGLKTGDVWINPTLPLPIQNDPPEPKEQPEPTPLNAPAEAPKAVDPQAEGEGGAE